MTKWIKIKKKDKNMEKEEFNNLLDKYLNETSLKFNEKQKEQLYLYMNLLIEWNEKII